MKKLIAMLLVGGFLTAGVIGCGPAATTEPPKATPPAGTPVTVTGKVKAVDADKKTVTVTADSKDTAFTVDKDTKITVAGAGDKKIDDVKKDADVTVKAKADNTAISIDVK